MEGTSAARKSGGSTSSRSDGSCDYDSMVKSHSFHRNFTPRRCFTPKPVHPLSFPSETLSRDIDSITPRGGDGQHLSSASGSVDLTEIPDPFDFEPSTRSCPSDHSFKCGLCERFLSQRSPWSSRRIIKTGDMPVAGILSCRHVFHAECLEQMTPKAHKSDPPCPICAKIEQEADQPIFSKIRSSFPRLKPFSEDGPSYKTWGCARAGDCVEGALHVPTSRNPLLALNCNRFKKNLSLKGNPSREFPGKVRAGGSFSSQLFIGSVEHGEASSSRTSGSSLK